MYSNQRFASKSRYFKALEIMPHNLARTVNYFFGSGWYRLMFRTLFT